MKTDGQLAQTFREAMKLWDEMKAKGVSLADRVNGLAATLKTAWPKGREEPWKYQCLACDDIGLRIGECPGDMTCGRTKPHGPHSFGTPCWCSLGARFKPKAKPSSDDFADAGKSKPMTKVGRR